MSTKPDVCHGLTQYPFVDTLWVYEMFVGNQPSGSGQRRGRFIAPTADLSAPILAVTAAIGADKSAVGAINRPLRSFAYN